VIKNGHSTTEVPSARLLLALLEKASEILAVVDAEGRVILESHNQTGLLGYETGELLGRNVFELVHPEDHAKALAAFQESIRQPGATRQIEARVRTKQGEWRWLYIVGSNLLNDPAVHGMVLNCRDITERKQAEEAARLAGRQWQETFDSVAEAIWIMDADGHIQRCNRAACELLGQTPDEIVGRPCRELVHADAERPADCPFERMRGSRRREEMELVLNGRWYHVTTDPLLDASGHLTGAVHILTDITERKRAEAAWAESRERFAAAFRLGPMLMALSELETGRYLEVNETFCRVLGFDRAKVIGKTSVELGLITAEQRQQLLKEIQEHGQVDGVELSVRKKNGEMITCRFFGRLLHAGNQSLLLSTVEDITERKRTEEELRKTQEMLAQAERLAHSGAWQWDIVADLWTFSTEWHNIHGTPRRTLSTRELLPIAHPEDRAMIEQAFADALAGRKPYDIEHRILRQDTGEVRVVKAHGHVVRDAKGKPLKMIGYAQDITERKKAEQALQESEAKYRRLHESMTDAFVQVDMSGRIQEFNPSYQDMLGYSAEELRQLTYVDITPEKWHAFEARIVAEQILPRGYSEVYEKEYRRKDGTVFPVELRTFLLRDDKGEPVGMWAIVRDITERKRIETVLRENEERHRFWLDAIPMLAWQCNEKGEAEICNRRWYEYTGEPPERTLGNGWQNALHPEDRERIARETVRAAQTGEPYNVQYRLRRADGTYRWHLARALPVRDPQGRIVKWVGCAVDIEDQKRLEAALRTSEEQFRSLANTVPVAIWMEDENGRPEYCNPYIQEYTGIPLERAQQVGGWWETVHPYDLQRLREIQRQAFSRKELTQWEGRLRCAATGQYRWFLGCMVPIKQPQGQALRWLGIATDIEEHKRLEELLEQRVQVRTAQLRAEMLQCQRLEQEILEISEREQRRIGQDLHDSVGQRLAGAKFLSSSLAHRLATAKSAAAAMARQISRELEGALEELHAISRGLHPVAAEPQSLMLAFYELAENTRKVFQIPCRFECVRPVLIHDRTAAIHLYRIAQEAVSNAVRHGKPGQIWISLRQSSAGIEIRIRDNGCGLPPAARRPAGMGLEIMKYRANVIGATLTIRRAKPRGTIVSCVWTPPPKGVDHANQDLRIR